MSDFSDRGILLRSIPYRETSCMLHILSEKHGRMSLLARGVRQKKSQNRAALAPLHLLELSWKKGKFNLGYLQHVRRLQPLLSEKNHIEGLEFNHLAYQLFPEHEPISMSVLTHAYYLLEHRTSGLLAASWYLLIQHGWVGQLHHCWHCMAHHTPLQWSKAHCCCQKCGQGMPLSKGLCLSIESILQNAKVRLSQRDSHHWLQMIQDVLIQHGLKRINVESIMLDVVRPNYSPTQRK